VDFPLRDNISVPYVMLWLTLVSGRTSQERMFWHSPQFWCHKFREYIEQGIPFKDLDRLVGNPSEIFQEWITHPNRGAYWDQYNPTAEHYAQIDLPILTITGFFDGDQPGALEHYRQHMRHASVAARARHFMVIGPWDHGGTRVPQPELYGIKLGAASLVDMLQLHLQWYAWTMRGGPKPEFLRKNVAYYVMGAEGHCI
jgi:predicted acyl esterase